jgi:hypothetical protein
MASASSTYGDGNGNCAYPSSAKLTSALTCGSADCSGRHRSGENGVAGQALPVHEIRVRSRGGGLRRPGGWPSEKACSFTDKIGAVPPRPMRLLTSGCLAVACSHSRSRRGLTLTAIGKLFMTASCCLSWAAASRRAESHRRHPGAARWREDPHAPGSARACTAALRPARGQAPQKG